MNVDFNEVTPIYIQIADGIEDDILSGKLKPGDSCYSQVTIAKECQINPATAAKGIRILVDRGILERKRGQAMIIVNDAIALIKQRKKDEILSSQIDTLIMEAKKLDLSQDDLIQQIKRRFSKL